MAEPCQEQAWVTIRGQRLAVEVAETRARQARGLGGRDALAWDRGMLFVYDQPGFYAFWMKDMRFDIDIVWIRDDRIVEISARVPHSPDGPGPTVRPRQLVNRVLELPAGDAQAWGWRIGDRVQVERPQPVSALSCGARASTARESERGKLGAQGPPYRGVQAGRVEADQLVERLVGG